MVSGAGPKAGEAAGGEVVAVTGDDLQLGSLAADLAEVAVADRDVAGLGLQEEAIEWSGLEAGRGRSPVRRLGSAPLVPVRDPGRRLPR